MYIKKRREICVLFLEAVFGTDENCSTLRDAGWQVECFADYFRDNDGRIRNSVKDPEIIKFCDGKKWLLITTDKDMRFTHIETIKQTEVAIIATANNHHTLDVWVNALIKSKAKIERTFKKQSRPWTAIISSTGNLTIETIAQEAFTRRRRPREGQES